MSDSKDDQKIEAALFSLRPAFPVLAVKSGSLPV
jgi:hypothetical protein